MRKRKNCNQTRNKARHNQSFVPVDGYEFETILPTSIASSNSNFEFGIRIRNPTSSPQRFLLFFLLPILWRRGYKERELIASYHVGANGTYFPESCNCQIIQPKDSVDFLVCGQFVRPDNQFWFCYRNQNGEAYQWWHCNPGDYQLQCKYYCSSLNSNSHFARQQKIGEFWLGEVVTPPIDFKFVG